MRKSVYYGWINVAVLWFSYGAVVASITYAYGVVVADMADSLGMTMTLATGAYTGYTLVHALTAPLAGKLINRCGAKYSMLTGLGLMLMGCLLLALCPESVAVYYLFWIVFIGLGMRLGTLIPSQVNISKWFFSRRSLAMAVLLTAGGIGGYVFAPICTLVNSRFSWRGVWLMIAALIAASMTLIALLLREDPEETGDPADAGIDRKDGSGKPKEEPSRNFKTNTPWELRDARRQIAFYMLVFLYFASSYQLSAISSQGINHLVLQGVDKSAAAGAVGLFAFINTFGRIAVGILGDRMGTKQVLRLGAVLSIAGFALLMGARDIHSAYAALILSGIGYGIVMVAPQNLLLDYFGTHDYANINSLYALIAGALSAIPAVLIGWFYDMNGNYSFAWGFGIILMAVSLVISVAIAPPILKTSKTQAVTAVKQL